MRAKTMDRLTAPSTLMFLRSALAHVNATLSLPTNINLKQRELMCGIERFNKLRDCCT